MDQIEWETSLKPSDWVSAALAYRKAMGDYKKFLIAVWILVGIAMISYVLPGFLFLGFTLMLCVPTETCSSFDLWPFTQLLIFTTIGCAFLVLVAHKNLLYRLRMEIFYRRMYLWNPDLGVRSRIFADNEEITVYEKTHKTTFYWNTFENILETEKSFIFSPKRNYFLLIVKRDFKNPDQMAQIRDIVEKATDKKVVFVK